MSDTCKHCMIRGNIVACLATPCHTHESWYAQQQDAEIELLRKLVHRYRHETPLGHQPHMITHEADAALAGEEAVVNQSLTTGEASDGYHTFNELYEHRHALFLNLMSWAVDEEKWISKLHDDGTGFDGWFIAGIELPTGTISYHLPERLWDAAVFTGATVMERAPEWDGHTSDDVVSRLYKMVAPYKDLAGKEGKP